jgi:hypothetical protein
VSKLSPMHSATTLQNPRETEVRSFFGLSGLPCFTGLCLGLAALLLVPGCATHASRLVLDPVGPGIEDSGIAATGYLQVFTATETMSDRGFFFYPYSGYNIYRPDGAHYQFVPNHRSNLDPVPTLVSLESGEYKIVARGEGTGLITVPVLIVAGEQTDVYLRRPGMPKAKLAQSDNVVRLPDGRVAGWRAQPPAAAGSR